MLFGLCKTKTLFCCFLLNNGVLLFLYIKTLECFVVTNNGVIDMFCFCQEKSMWQFFIVLFFVVLLHFFSLSIFLLIFWHVYHDNYPLRRLSRTLVFFECLVHFRCFFHGTVKVWYIFIIYHIWLISEVICFFFCEDGNSFYVTTDYQIGLCKMKTFL